MKVVILGNYATQFLAKSLKNSFKQYGLSVELYSAEFNTTEYEILDENSQLYKFKPDYIVWHESTLGIRDAFYKTDTLLRAGFADSYISRTMSLVSEVHKRLPSVKILFPNHSLTFNDNLFGNYFAKVESSWRFQVDKINYLLNASSLTSNSFYVISSSPVDTLEPVTDYTQVANAELHFTLSYLTWMSGAIVKIVQTFSGKFAKCVVLDLDNTLWGGVIGDDGVEGIQLGSHGIGKSFVRFQKWLKELKNRGIILAVCSKNDDQIARIPFLEHPEMILKMEDIAVFIANWQSKADNLAQIQKILNIGFDSIVFLDDNPAERDIVRKHIPGIIVPELPEDPSYYLPFLIKENIFETTSFSANDSERTRQYQEESKRMELSSSITNMDDFLNSLEMSATLTSFGRPDYERISQLTQRSNQFNLRTVRYTTSDIANIASDDSFLTLAVELSDKFGKYGLISVVIIKLSGTDAHIDTWIMSCRVLKRTVEHMAMNHVIDILQEKGIQTLYGEYLPTAKNKLVETLLEDLGMTEYENDKFIINTESYKKLKTYIKYAGDN